MIARAKAQRTLRGDMHMIGLIDSLTQPWANERQLDFGVKRYWNTRETAGMHHIHQVTLGTDLPDGTLQRAHHPVDLGGPGIGDQR